MKTVQIISQIMAAVVPDFGHQCFQFGWHCLCREEADTSQKSPSRGLDHGQA